MTATFLRKFFFQVFPVLFAISTATAQTAPAHSFGEGVVTIGWYTFGPHDATATDPLTISHIPHVYGLTYYIRQNKILRKDQADTSSDKDSSVTRTTDANGVSVTFTLHAEMAHPSYLIDWNERKAYSKDSGWVPLQKETREIFYRAIDNNNTTVILSLQKDSPVYIAGMKCYKGIAKGKDETFPFYYSDALSKVRSPLNGFLPADFPYNVMRVDFVTDWYQNNVKTGKAAMIFQVLSVKEGLGEGDEIF